MGGSYGSLYYPQQRDPSDENKLKELLREIDKECETWRNTTRNIRENKSGMTAPREITNYLRSALDDTIKKFQLDLTTAKNPQTPQKRPRETLMKSQMDALLREKEDLQKKLQAANRQLGQLQEHKTKSRESDLEKENTMLKLSLDKMTEQFEKVKDERDVVLTRLSKLISDRIHDNNPNIADLSDPNRPTKLAEVYTELYDNEWTDAFDALVKSGHEEEIAIETLRLTLMNCWQFCNEISSQMVEKIESTLQDLFNMEDEQLAKKAQTVIFSAPKGHKPTARGKPINRTSLHERFDLQRRWMSTESSDESSPCDMSATMVKPLNIEQRLQKERKEIAVSFVPFVRKAYMKTLWNAGSFLPEMKPYIKTCLFVCWMMVVQTPPMCIDTDVTSGIPFDQKSYKEYLKRGPKVEFVVWPALRLHANGPLMAKGVAQGAAE